MIILVLLLTIGLVYIVFYIMRIYAKKTKDKYNNTNVSSELNEKCDILSDNSKSRTQLTNKINQEYDDSVEGDVIRYASWTEYKSKHPERAKAIISLGLNISQKNDIDASEMIFAIETTAHDSKCKISELKKKYYELAEKHNYSDGEWLYLINSLVEVSKSEAAKYNLKIGNTFADVMISFVLDKIKEIEKNHANEPSLTSTDPNTLIMRFMLDSHSEILLLQKMHIYTKNFPLTAYNSKYRENWHNKMISIITDRLTKYEELKNQPSIYNMCVSMEIHKFIYEEMLKDVPKNW